jgi:protein-tyrosine kinase
MRRIGGWRGRCRLRRQRAAASQPLHPPAPFDSSATVSQPFSVDFRALERKGYIGRSSARRRLARDMRALRHRLLNRMHAFRLQDDDPSIQPEAIVMVTSCLPGEGKTFTAVNLALSIMLEDCIDVMLVDADIVNPSIDRTFGFRAERGLVDYLRIPEENLSPYLWRAENGRLTILPAGAATVGHRSLFRGGAMSRFVCDISRRYAERIVIVDSPPLLASGEAAVLANHADHILLVVECGRTAQSTLEDALDLLTTHDNVSLVLNRCNEGDRLTPGTNESYGFRRQQSA